MQEEAEWDSNNGLGHLTKQDGTEGTSKAFQYYRAVCGIWR